METDVSDKFQKFAAMAGEYEAVLSEIQKVIHDIHTKSSVFSESVTNIRKQINNVKTASSDNEQGVDDIIVKNDLTTQTADSIIKIVGQNQPQGLLKRLQSLRNILKLTGNLVLGCIHGHKVSKLTLCPWTGEKII